MRCRGWKGSLGTAAVRQRGAAGGKGAGLFHAWAPNHSPPGILRRTKELSASQRHHLQDGDIAHPLQRTGRRASRKGTTRFALPQHLQHRHISKDGDNRQRKIKNKRASKKRSNKSKSSPRTSYIFNGRELKFVI